MDTLSNVVQMLRLRASVFLQSSFCGDYAVEPDRPGKAIFHVVSSGKCWLHMPELESPVQLHEGDLVFFPHETMHTFSNSITFPADDVPRNQPATTPAGDYVSLICGEIDFMQSRWNPILESLPDFLVLRGGDAYHTSEFESLLDVMIKESNTEHMGSKAVIDRLSDVLFIHVLRAYLEKHKDDSGYLAALFDTKIGPVLRAIHDEPERNWTVQKLAELANMSRSAFAEHFNSQVGISPMQYVTNWRMQVAFEKLAISEQSMAQIAEQCGYQSESSFSKAFKKQFGVNPGVIHYHS